MIRFARKKPETPEPGLPPVGVTSLDVSTVLQPVIDVVTGTVVGYEALARFATDPHDAEPTGPGATSSVTDRFADAHAHGFGAELEAACLWAALGRRGDIPDGTWLAVNVSPDVLSHPQVEQALAGDLRGIVVEITEQPDSNLAALDRALVGLRERGALIAVDDASTGYAGLLRLTRLRPDIVKLDAHLVAAAADRAEQSAVIEALVSLSRRIGARVIGEGVETIDELRALADLDVDYAQGFVIARPAADAPAPAPHAVNACRAARRDLLRAPASTTARWTDFPGTRLHPITAALAASVNIDELTAIVERAALSLGVDVISVSTLADGQLREVATVGSAPDDTAYPLTRFPATQAVLQTAAAAEIHVDDDTADAAERQLLTELDLSSLLIVPLIRDGRPVGILELSHRTPQKWRNSDIHRAQTLADHIVHTLQRIITHTELAPLG